MRKALAVIGLILAVHVMTAFGVTSMGIFELELENGGPGIFQIWLTLSLSSVFAVSGAGLVGCFADALLRSQGDHVRIFLLILLFIFLVPMVIGLGFWRNSEAFAIQFLSSQAYSLGAGSAASVIGCFSLKPKKQT